MDPDLGAALQRFRNAYAYPAAHISAQATLAPPPSGLNLGYGIAGLLQSAVAGPATNLALDAYHGSLLRSMVPADTFLGCASVVYWGFRTFSAEFGLARVRRLAGLAPPIVGVTPATTNLALGRVRTEIANRRWGNAVGHLSSLSQLRQLPFASKIITFLDPLNAGVYDNRLNNFLAADPLGVILMGGSGAWPSKRRFMVNPAVSRPVAQQFYERWCLRLQQLRDALNADRITWIGTETVRQCWRAVDVERALFFLAAMPTPALANLPPDTPECDRGTEGSEGAATRPTDIDLPDILRRLRDFYEGQPPIEQR